DSDRCRPPPGGDAQCEHSSGPTGSERDHEANKRSAHRPVSPRSAATIAPGGGGHPGTSTSTGTTSETAPATPYAPANTPQFIAQSPTATTRLGAGTAS